MKLETMEDKKLRPANILAVDDTPANLQVLTGMLKEKGYKVRPVTSGVLALRAARLEAPDLILLDINMPDMTGYEVCRVMKEEEGLKRIPVIFVSALSEQLDKVNAFGLGGVDYLTKPFHMEELYARVETHLKISRLQLELERCNERLESANAVLKEVNVRMSGELRAAARVQRTFLPRKAPSVAGLEFSWIFEPCDELAGDGLNIIALEGGAVGLYVLDVSGHGVTAALLSVTMSRLLSPPSDPSSILMREGVAGEVVAVAGAGEVADRLNRLFPFDSLTAQFATLAYGVLDPVSGEFRYVLAGHPGPILLRREGELVMFDNPGYPIGLGKDAYEECVIQMRKGDRLYLFSDGVPEAMNPLGRVFGYERLKDAIKRGRGQTLKQSIEGIQDELNLWREDGRAQDDVSILAVEMGREAFSG